MTNPLTVREQALLEAVKALEMALDNYFSYSPSRRDGHALGPITTARSMASKAVAMAES